jgi:hypothetical protein
MGMTVRAPLLLAAALIAARQSVENRRWTGHGADMVRSTRLTHSGRQLRSAALWTMSISWLINLGPPTAPGKRYSITSSARVSNASGIVSPIVLAALRFTTSWYFTGAWTGMSPGLSPLRMRSTVDTDCRHISSTSAP